MWPEKCYLNFRHRKKAFSLKNRESSLRMKYSLWWVTAQVPLSNRGALVGWGIKCHEHRSIIVWNGILIEELYSTWTKENMIYGNLFLIAWILKTNKTNSPGSGTWILLMVSLCCQEYPISQLSCQGILSFFAPESPKEYFCHVLHIFSFSPLLEWIAWYELWQIILNLSQLFLAAINQLAKGT